MMNVADVTTAQIDARLATARTAGDFFIVALCEIALGNDPSRATAYHLSGTQKDRIDALCPPSLSVADAAWAARRFLLGQIEVAQ